MATYSSERRSEPRQECFKVIEYSCSSGGPKALRGFVLNMSSSGICIRAYSRLEEGQDIDIRNNQSSLSMRATVRWVKQLSEKSYVAGLVLAVESGDDFFSTAEFFAQT